MFSSNMLFHMTIYTAKYPPLPVIGGNINVVSPNGCTEELKEKLRQEFIRTMQQINAVSDLVAHFSIELKAS